MILIDSAVWIDHLRKSEPQIATLLRMRNVLSHPFILGEIAMGSFRKRAEILGELNMLPNAILAQDEEVQKFVTRYALFGLGIGYIDAHLLVSARLTANALLWTRDKRLFAAAEKLGLAMIETPPRPN